MIRLISGFVAISGFATVLYLAPPFVRQAVDSGGELAAQERQPGRGDNRPPGGRPGGGFPIPTPPVLSALDKDGDGELSDEEMKNAVAALRTLDKDKSGELATSELMPSFGGRSPFGRGGSPFGGGANTKQLAPEDVKFNDGAASIPDHATFHKLSYRGEEVMIDTFLANLEFVKFTINEPASEHPQFYFINTKTHRAHMMFGRVAGLPFSRGPEQMKGVLVYRPMLKAPNGESGLFTFEFEPFDDYTIEMVMIAYDLLIEKMPILKGRLGYYPRGERATARYEEEKAPYDLFAIDVYQDDDLVNTEVGYLPLNPGTSFGRLRLMGIDERPGPRDVVLYETLPNEMPRVAGIITAVRQTPLSHVNLRAVQDKVPNAFISGAAENDTIKSLIGKDVAYSVTADGYEIRAATADEVEAHFAHLRPTEAQVLKRDVSVKKIRPLDAIGFDDSSSVGVKAANLATMRTFGFPKGTVPDGFAVPFYFYDEFMKHNGFYEHVSGMLENAEFQNSRDVRQAQLKKFRSLIKKGTMPEWMMQELDEVHKSFPEGSSVRCRSSTNNEDLPGFSGAGLYDSCTHKPDEGHFSKSIRQVFASLWNFRAFEEREFYRVDHLTAAMGVLVHPNFKGELVNGVAVTDDILYQTDGNYYFNTQVGEDLVTNPDEASVPEEVLVDWWDSRKLQIRRTSNRAVDGNPLLSANHVEQLRDHLAYIHARFARLYGESLDNERFAMEIEFKVTSKGDLAIKQARPWVYAAESAAAGDANEEEQ